MLADVVIGQDGLPSEWKDQAAVFYSWFESVGFNRLSLKLDHFCVSPCHEATTASICRNSLRMPLLAP